MGAMASQITSLTIIYLTVYSGVHQRKHQRSASLAFVWGIHRWPVNSPHKWPVTRKMFPFDDVMILGHCITGPDYAFNPWLHQYPQHQHHLFLIGLLGLVASFVWYPAFSEVLVTEFTEQPSASLRAQDVEILEAYTCVWHMLVRLTHVFCCPFPLDLIKCTGELHKNEN